MAAISQAEFERHLARALAVLDRPKPILSHCETKSSAMVPIMNLRGVWLAILMSAVFWALVILALVICL